ncbi:MAG: hypothetical protein AVO39_02175 [delta proteobacterium MLS_D]|jgi:hypothetical protein|nr:MAG: hypothetical protein AVO39_02175 [delta proteobacterium MLS_D]
MNDGKELEEAGKFELDRYLGPPKRPEGHVSFTGALEKHPHNPEKIVLIVDPFSSHLLCYEFNRADIGGLEELPSIATSDGEAVHMYRIWVRKGSIGVQSIPFIVDDIAGKWNR